MRTHRFLELFTAIVSIFAAMATGQTAAPKSYAEEPFVIDSLVTRYVFQNDGTGMTETTARVKVQSDAGVKQFGILAFPYEKDAEDLTVDYARVRKPDGSVVVTPAEDVQDIDTEVSRIAPMYSSVRQKHVAIRNLSAGDVLEYHSKSHLHTPLAPGQFWGAHAFFRDGIILDEQVEVDVPAGRYVNVKSADVKPTVTEANGRKLYRWKTSNLHRKTDEEKAKESKKEPPPPSIQLTTFKTWDEIAKWYGELQRDRVRPTDEIRAKAVELTKSSKSDEEKLRAIYKYVSSEFRYIGLEFGVGRYQPHAASAVFQNRYGDCKDKQTLLAAMLDAIGLKAEPVLLNSSRTVDEEVPSPTQFDHLIGLVHVSGRDYWLDTTPEVAPFGMLLYAFRDKRVLVAGEKAEWRKTPATSPVETEATFEAVGTLSADGKFKAKMDQTLRGDPEVLVRTALRSIGQPQWKDLVQQMSYNTGFSGTVSDVQITPGEPGDGVRIQYEYSRKDYSEWNDNHRLMGALPTLSIAPLRREDDTSDDPITLAGPFKERYRSIIEVPSGYTPEALPDVNLHTDFADYVATYRVEGQTVSIVRELTVKRRELPASRRAEFNKLAKAVVDDESSFILTKNGSSEGIAAAAAALGKTLDLPTEDAATLFERGRQEMQAHRAQPALTLFQRVAELDDNYKGVWTSIGFCQLVLGKPDEAFKSLRKEVEKHPQDPQARKTLAQALLAMRHSDEALEVMREYLKLAPEDTAAATAVAQQYSQMGKYKDAVEVIEAVVKGDTRDVVILRVLGHAYAKVGDSDKAISTLRHAVELKPDDALTLNDAAYYLAESKLSLDDARGWAETAVRAEERKTEGISLDSLTQDDLRRVSRIAAYWDTLGWVYFQSGDIAKAESYLKPAWMLSQAPDMGEHLGAVYEKQGKKLLAAKAYAQASRPFGVASTYVPENKSLESKVATLVGSVQAKVMISKAGEDLSQARTFRLPNFAHGVGSGEFFVAVGSDQKVSAKFVSGEDSLRRTSKGLEGALAGKLTAMIPSGEQVTLVRRAIVVCHQTPSYCEFVLITPDLVSTN